MMIDAGRGGPGSVRTCGFRCAARLTRGRAPAPSVPDVQPATRSDLTSTAPASINGDRPVGDTEIALPSKTILSPFRTPPLARFAAEAN